VAPVDQLREAVGRLTRAAGVGAEVAV
jgi:hypothetical protein